ncbi:hypothetical protein TNCV_407191 [Trichonephila clavipes]|nr:hypothetical protein TNCV_407191 [Trichonephila clavipes]
MVSSAKEQKEQDSKCNREFQIWWTEKHGIILVKTTKRCVFYVLEQWNWMTAVAEWIWSRTRGRRAKSSSPNANEDPLGYGANVPYIYCGSQSPPMNVVWKLGDGVLAQVSSSSLDGDSKLRAPSP